MAKKKSAKSTAKPRRRVTKAQAPYIAEQLRGLAVEVQSLDPDPHNPRKHGPEDLASIAKSLERFGQRTPLVVNRRTNYILKGNGTWLAAQQLDWKYLAVVFVDDAPQTASRYKIADNRTAELSEWNEELLSTLLAELDGQEDDDRFLEDFALQDFLSAVAGDEDDDEDEDPDAEPTTYKILVTFSDADSQQEWLEKIRGGAGVLSCTAISE